MRAERRAPVQQRHAVPPGCTAAPIQLARTPGGVSSGSGSAPWTRARESIAWSPPSSLMSNLLGARACETRGRYHYQHRSEFCLGPRIVHFLLALRLLSSPTPRALQHTAMAHASGAELMDKITFQAFRALQDDLQQVGTCRQPREPHRGGGGRTHQPCPPPWPSLGCLGRCSSGGPSCAVVRRACASPEAFGICELARKGWHPSTRCCHPSPRQPRVS